MRGGQSKRDRKWEAGGIRRGGRGKIQTRSGRRYPHERRVEREKGEKIVFQTDQIIRKQNTGGGMGGCFGVGWCVKIFLIIIIKKKKWTLFFFNQVAALVKSLAVNYLFLLLYSSLVCAAWDSSEATSAVFSLSWSKENQREKQFSVKLPFANPFFKK